MRHNAAKANKSAAAAALRTTQNNGRALAMQVIADAQAASNQGNVNVFVTRLGID